MSSESYRSRYGIEKLREHTYQNWSFQCKMLLSEKKVWNIVNGSYPRPREVEAYSDQYWAMTGFAERFNTVKCLKSSLLTLKTLPKPGHCPSLMLFKPIQ